MLPDLVLIKVFSFFEIPQRFRLRLVCKRWYALMGHVKQQTLCIYEDSFPIELLSPNQELEVWPGEMVWIDTEKEPEVKINLEARFFRKLAHLYLHHIRRPVHLIAQINRLEFLKELGLVRVSFEGLKLELKHLETLRLKRTFFDYLDLDTPNLSTLVLWKCGWRGLVKVHFPEKVNFLECESVGPNFDLKQFVNLEVLLTRKLAINLADFTKLKEVDLRDEEKQVWEDLKAQKERLGRKDLKIYSFGFQEIFFRVSHPDVPIRISQEYPFAENYALLARPIPFKIILNYRDLLSKFNMIRDGMPKDLFGKLTNILRIYLMPWSSESVSHLDLIRIVKESKCRHLCVHTGLPQEFYNLLPDCFFSDLRITNLSSGSCNLKFDFLPRLTKLSTVILALDAKEMPFGLICEAIEKCKFFSWFCCIAHFDDKSMLNISIRFNYKDKTTKEFKVNNERLENRSMKETIRYLKEIVSNE